MHIVGGAARSEVWREILAAVPRDAGGDGGGEAAYGHAMLAAVGVGAATADDLAGWVQAADHQRRVEPDGTARQTYDDVYPEYLALYMDLRERFAALAQRR